MFTLETARPFILDPMSQLSLLVETWARASLTDGRVNIYNLNCVLCDTVLIYSLISIRCTPELWNIRLLKTKQKQKKKKNPRLRDLSVKKFETPRRKKTRENETSRPLKNAFEISRSGRNFPSPTFFEVPFATPTYFTTWFSSWL